MLICNTVFNAELKLKDRKGTEKDIEAIKRVFRDILGFEVVEYKQLKVHEMLREIGAGLWQTETTCNLPELHCCTVLRCCNFCFT